MHEDAWDIPTDEKEVKEISLMQVCGILLIDAWRVIVIDQLVEVTLIGVRGVIS